MYDGKHLNAVIDKMYHPRKRPEELRLYCGKPRKCLYLSAKLITFSRKNLSIYNELYSRGGTA